ncbi:MAG: hypothetical protein RL329_1495 [Bacteroidota bacterium]|jgi:hypothetical protein
MCVSFQTGRTFLFTNHLGYMNGHFMHFDVKKTVFFTNMQFFESKTVIFNQNKICLQTIIYKPILYYNKKDYNIKRSFNTILNPSNIAESIVSSSNKI